MLRMFRNFESSVSEVTFSGIGKKINTNMHDLRKTYFSRNNGVKVNIFLIQILYTFNIKSIKYKHITQTKIFNIIVMAFRYLFIICY